jgi:hypothetical protein
MASILGSCGCGCAEVSPCEDTKKNCSALLHIFAKSAFEGSTPNILPSAPAELVAIFTGGLSCDGTVGVVIPNYPGVGADGVVDSCEVSEFSADFPFNYGNSKTITVRIPGVSYDENGVPVSDSTKDMYYLDTVGGVNTYFDCSSGKVTGEVYDFPEIVDDQGRPIDASQPVSENTYSFQVTTEELKKGYWKDAANCVLNIALTYNPEEYDVYLVSSHMRTKVDPIEILQYCTQLYGVAANKKNDEEQELYDYSIYLKDVDSNVCFNTSDIDNETPSTVG